MKPRSEKPVLLFLVSTLKGLPIFVHPFHDKKQLRTEENLEGRYGSAPEMETTVLLRNLLYEQVDKEIREWASETQFFPRFIASLFVFFVAFFFMAWAIRDVIPLVDELLVATLAAVSTYVAIGRKVQTSKPALEQKIILKKKIDSLHFTQRSYMIDLEKIFRVIHAAEGSFDRANISEEYEKLSKDIVESDYRDEIIQLSEGISVSDHKKHRFKKLLAKNVFVKSTKPEEQLYIITQALLMGISLRDFVQN